MQYLKRNPKIKKGKFPVNVVMQTEQFDYDIIAVKEIEVETLYEKIDEVSQADRIIIIIESKNDISIQLPDVIFGEIKSQENLKNFRWTNIRLSRYNVF